MAYQRKQWEESVTPLSAENMNNIEDGIEEALTKAKGNTDLWHYIRNLVYPVGSIYISTDSTNPGERFGGTWVAWGSGRVPVGVDSTQGEFSVAERTGGEKTHTLSIDELPSHTHAQESHNHTQNKHSHGNYEHNHTADGSASLSKRFISTDGAESLNTDVGGGISGSGWRYPRVDSENGFSSSYFTGSTAISIKDATATNNPATAVNKNTGGGQAHNNLQPYITCYMWKRMS